MKREKRPTKRERKATNPTQAQPQAGAEAQHIHCIACGRHLDGNEFQGTSPTALYLACDHKTEFPSCTECQVTARYLIAEHDRTGNPVAVARAWH
jgi:NAD-dependent SIR2 family protein deacetylase